MDVNAHYTDEADKHGLAATSTMKDTVIRELEIEVAIKLLSHIDPHHVVEIGCGNGYASERILGALGNITERSWRGIDSNEAMIELARKRTYGIFVIDDISDLKSGYSAVNDAVFSERCLINLPSWHEQHKALENVYGMLRVGGYAIFIETFTDGYENINEARAAVGLPNIYPPDHNQPIIKSVFMNAAKEIGFVDAHDELVLQLREEYENFLSTYYFASRCLYPALVKDVKYNTAFAGFFKDMPAFGNHSPIQCIVLKKVKK